VGGTFDYLAGVRRLAPRWMRRAGLEWLFRLLSQPSRWRRQTALLHFAGSALIEAATKRR
jgi:exopolysaccharide biosynthesis WecB/TagA/CpsF family protein